MDAYEYMLNNIPHIITLEDNATLCKPIFEEEVWEVIRHMNPDKTSVLNGFSAHFYQKCWNIIKRDLVRMI
jgi:hypothetical protein